MTYHVFDKKPAEFALRGVDMSAALPTGVTLQSSNANGTLGMTVKDKEGNAVTLTIVHTSPYISGSSIYFVFKNGVADEEYYFNLTVPLSDGQVLEEEGSLVIYEAISNG